MLTCDIGIMEMERILVVLLAHHIQRSDRHSVIYCNSIQYSFFLKTAKCCRQLGD